LSKYAILLFIVVLSSLGSPSGGLSLGKARLLVLSFVRALPGW